MKKFFALLFTLLLSLICFGVVACGAEDNTDNTDTTGDQTPQVVYTVSEIEYNAAIDVTGAPFQVAFVETEQEAQGTSQYFLTFHYNSGKIYEEENWGSGGSLHYYSMESDQYFKFSIEDGVWQKEESQSYLSALNFANPKTFLTEELDLHLQFSSFTYNEANKAYVHSFVDGDETVTVSIMFQNAKVVKLSAVYQSDMETETVELSYTYNDVAVVLPTPGSSAGA